MKLNCHGVQVSIGDVRVVSGLDIEAGPGEFWGLLGANGVGKTTLLRNLAGLLTPESGRIELGMRKLRAWPRRELARSLGMLQQHTLYVFDASVLQIALTGRHPYLAPWEGESGTDREIARRAIRAVDLGAMEQRSVTSLSGGEARRLAFAALLVQEPEVMLLDEPTNHLDFRHQVKIMRRVGNEVYGRERLALAALHDVNLAATYCSHVLMLFGGGEWRAGPAHELLTATHLERLYRCPVNSVDTPHGPRFHPAFEPTPDKRLRAS